MHLKQCHGLSKAPTFLFPLISSFTDVKANTFLPGLESRDSPKKRPNNKKERKWHEDLAHLRLR